MTAPDLFADTQCRLCAHWTGDEQHVVQQVAARCRHKDRRTFADDTCPAFVDAGQRTVA